jgi:hypothetical protein
MRDMAALARATRRDTPAGSRGEAVGGVKLGCGARQKENGRAPVELRERGGRLRSAGNGENESIH